MKKNLLKILILVIILMFLVSCGKIEKVLKETKGKELNSTNLQKVELYISSNYMNEAYIKIEDKTYEVDADEIVLFYNGSILDEFAVKRDDGKIFISEKLIKKFTNNLTESIKDYSIEELEKHQGNYVDFNEVRGQLETNSKTFKVKEYIDEPYLDDSLAVGIPCIFISDYPEDAKTLSKEEALKILKKQLIEAYEKKYGKFKPLDKNPNNSKEYVGDETMFRYTFSHLEVDREIDRFYVVSVVWDFWVDKYTGDVFVYYNGDLKSIYKFDPKNPNSLMFAG